MFEPKEIVGYSTDKYLLLDVDNSTLIKTEGLVKIIQKNYNVGDALILRSTNRKRYIYEYMPYLFTRAIEGSYHIVFGRRLKYDKILDIISVLVDLGYFDREYYEIRKWRKDLTLRISADNSTDRFREKPIAVKIIFNVNSPTTFKDYEGILEYLRFYNVV